MLVEPVDIVNCDNHGPRSVYQQRANFTKAKLKTGEKYGLTNKVSLILPEDKSQGLWLRLEDPEKGLSEDYNFQVTSVSRIEARASEF